MVSPGSIEAQFRHYRERKRNLLNGFLFGAIVGEALGFPFRGIPVNDQLQHDGRNINTIDRLYMNNVGYQGRWLPEACRLFNSWRALINLHQREGSLRLNLRGGPLQDAFLQNYESHQQIGTDPREKGHLSHLRPYSLFMKLAPVAPFSVACGLSVDQVINFCCRIASLTHKHPAEIFPAVEFVLLLRAVCGSDERIPDAVGQLKKHAIKRGGRRRIMVDRYLSDREQLPERSETALGVWLHINASILGLDAGEPFSELQGFENGLIRVVNTSPVRDLAGAVAGALLGANWGQDMIPYTFRCGIRGDAFIYEFVRTLLTIFHPFERAKQYKPYRPPKTPPTIQLPRLTMSSVPRLFYQEQTELSCKALTVAVKNRALKSRYPGGVAGFALKHRAKFNRQLAVACNLREFDPCVGDLLCHGLKAGEDFLYFDARDVRTKFNKIHHKKDNNMQKPIDKWLNLYSSSRGVLVWLVEDPANTASSRPG